MRPVLAVSGLEVTFSTDRGPFKAVDGISFEAHAGSVVGVVGESGSGKSVMALSMLGLLGNLTTFDTGAPRSCRIAKRIRKISAH